MRERVDCLGAAPALERGRGARHQWLERLGGHGESIAARAGAEHPQAVPAYNQPMAETSSGLVGGRYRILGKLGKGAMGLVFMAHDPVLDRKVAIKQMTAEIADNEELRQRFYVEARAAARLNHPNIITIHELQESGGEIFMIMELLEGKSLASLIEARPVPLSLEATLDVMSQVCDGLDYAHQRAIVHRDIKPANLFLTPSGTVKILDFGIARLGSLHMTATGALIGTPDYMAPEQIRGDEIDRRTDLWAVGAVLYQLLSGTKPFEGTPLARLLSAIPRLPHTPLLQRAPAVPKGVSDLVDRLLSKPREGRPATAGLVRDELRAILGRESSAATRATLAEADYEETLFMATASRPPAPASLAAAQAPAVPPSPPPLPAGQQRVTGRSGAVAADGCARVRRDVAPEWTFPWRPRRGRSCCQWPRRQAPPVAARSAPPVAARPQQPSGGSRRHAEEVGVAAAHCRRRLGGRGALQPHSSWRRSVVVYFTQRGATSAGPAGAVAATTPATDSTSTPAAPPPAQAKAEPSSPAAPAADWPAVDAPPAIPTQTDAPPAAAGVLDARTGADSDGRAGRPPLRRSRRHIRPRPRLRPRRLPQRSRRRRVPTRQPSRPSLRQPPSGRPERQSRAESCRPTPRGQA